MKAAALALVLFLGGCCYTDLAAQHAEVSQLVTRAHAKDAALPLQARQLAWDQYLAWSVQRELLTGEPLPADVKAALEAPP
jgi:hypothetical protein